MNFTSVKNNKKTINLKNKNKNYEVNAQWLYEHSTNSKIRDNYTNQLLIEAAEIDEHLYVKSAKINKNVLQIQFSDNSKHSYQFSYLHNQLESEEFKSKKFLWNKGSIKIPKFNFLLINKKMLSDILLSVETFGFCLVRNIPKTKNGLNELMKLIGPVKKTNWGGIADVKNIKKAYDLTMTTRALENHTDNPYRFPTQGYIFLHCIENASIGGENTIVDGFNVAKILRDRHKQFFNTLTTFNTFFRYKDENAWLENKCKLIELDDMNNVIQVRYNNRTELIPFDKNKKIDDYINARRKLWDLIKDKKNNIHIKQRPGDMLILDNYRVLHGRGAYEQIKNFGYLENRISSSSAPTLSPGFIRTLSITQSFSLFKIFSIFIASMISN